MDSLLFVEGRCYSGDLHLTTPSFVALFTLSSFDSIQMKVVIVDLPTTKNAVLHEITFSFSFSVETKTIDECPHMVQNCKLPATLVNGELWCTSGLSSSVRHILHEKATSGHCEDKLAKRLLGFRNGCLQACAEVSVWTKFCEVEVTEMVDKWINNGNENNTFPEELARFENHLLCPPITHNVLKKKQEHLGSHLTKEELSKLKRKKLHELPTLKHKFAEGLDLTLADLFIFSTFSFLFMSHSLRECISVHFPLVNEWYHTVKSEKCIQNVLPLLNACIGKIMSTISLIVPKAPQESLYKSDPERYKPRWRAFTNQKDIDTCINKLQSLKFNETLVDLKTINEESMLSEQMNSIHINGEIAKDEQLIEVSKFRLNNEIRWDQLPSNVNLHKQLPTKRLDRKQQQLENMAVTVMSMAKPGDTIVDFCSGSGHLGILLAYCLPQCKIFLVENKQASLSRAFDRVTSSGLRNIQFYQCNLDYFNGSFNIGVCLHACGVATDLVIKKCVDNAASFICSPCCYGSIQSNHILKYPRSHFYHNFNITPENYYILSHAADQTHDEKNCKTNQGIHCMRLVDHDRLCYTKENGYNARLALMNPPSCTPKNHMLIGIHGRT